MDINWYPGHMAKTKKEIIENLKLIDIVVELLDARIPLSSQNPDIEKWIQEKQRMIVLNKSDLAAEEGNKKWIQYFGKQQIPAVLVDSNSGKGVKEALCKLEAIYHNNAEKFANRGRVGKSMRVMILGIPNVGKSSFINRIVKKNSARVGNRPGVTRQKQWVRINSNIELLDTPGVLWPKFESEEIGLKLAYTGTIKDDILQTIEIGFSLLKYFIKFHQSNLIERYQLDENIVKQILSNDTGENEKALELMNQIGQKRGAIISGGNVDQDKVAKMILDDFRSGKLGRITLELPY